MDNQNHEQEIDLKDLIFTVLHKWRGIVLAAIIIGVLLGGYKLSAGLRHRAVGTDTQKTDYIDNLDSYNTSKMMYTNGIGFIKDEIDSLQDYYMNSVLMHINPYNEYVATADVFVNVDMPKIAGGTYLVATDPADSILKAYESSIKRADAIGNVSGTVIKPEYLRELITTSVDYTGNVLTVTAVYKDEAGAKQILDALLDSLKNEYPAVQRTMGSHNIEIMNERVDVVTDQGLANTQQACTNSLSALQKSLTDTKNALKALIPPTPPTGIASVGVGSAIKYGILGIVLGAFLSIFCICVTFLMSDKLSSDKELKKRFGIRILGVFAQVPRVRVFMTMDRCLDHLEGKVSRKPAEVYEIMAVNVKNYMKEGKKILIIGSAANDKMTEIAKELVKRLPGVEIQVGQDIEHYAETLRLLPEAGQIILVEERGKSKYGEIQNQIEVIRSLEKDIIGCVVM